MGERDLGHLARVPLYPLSNEGFADTNKLMSLQNLLLLLSNQPTGLNLPVSAGALPLNFFQASMLYGAASASSFPQEPSTAGQCLDTVKSAVSVPILRAPPKSLLELFQIQSAGAHVNDATRPLFGGHTDSSPSGILHSVQAVANTTHSSRVNAHPPVNAIHVEDTSIKMKLLRSEDDSNSLKARKLRESESPRSNSESLAEMKPGQIMEVDGSASHSDACKVEVRVASARKCRHNRQKSRCKDCKGSGVCEHNRQRSYCKDCGGSGICEHRRKRSMCKDCRGASICKHLRQRSRCKECGGSQICEHNRRRSLCKECGGSQICAHQRQRGLCKDCGGSQICPHQRRKQQCKECKAERARKALEAITEEKNSESGL